MIQQSSSHLLMCRPHIHNISSSNALPAGYELRLAHDYDINNLATLLSLAFDYTWDAHLVRTKLTEASDVRAVYVVTWQNKPVATASSRYLPIQFPDGGYVHWVGTHPDHTRKGLATALMHCLLEDFIQRGYTYAVLETDDFRLSALRAYLKLGFLPVYDAHNEDHRGRWMSVFEQIF